MISGISTGEDGRYCLIGSELQPGTATIVKNLYWPDSWIARQSPGEVVSGGERAGVRSQGIEQRPVGQACTSRY